MPSKYVPDYTSALQELEILEPIESLQHCRVQSALVLVDGVWVPYYTKIRFSRESFATQSRSEVHLSCVRLVEEDHSAKSVMTMLNEEEPHFMLLVERRHVNSRNWGITSPRDPWHDFFLEPTPCYLVTTEPHGWVSDEVKPFKANLSQALAHKIPHGDGCIFTTIDDAIDWWMGLPATRRVGNGTPGVLVQITIPLCRGLLKEIERHPKNGLHVVLEPGRPDEEIVATLSVKDEKSYSWESKSPRNGVVHFESEPTGPYAISIACRGIPTFLFKSRAELLPVRVVSEAAEQGLVSRLIEGGENERCEFKNWGDPKGKFIQDDFWDNVRKNVAGMANSFGGTILFGVDDEGQVFGLEPFRLTMASHFEAESREIQEKIIIKIRKFISDRLNVVPTTEMKWVEVGNKTILKIDVMKNLDSRLTMDGAQNPYIRTGSTTRRATFEECSRLPGRKIDRTF